MADANDLWEKKLQDPSATPMSLPLGFLKAITCGFSSERELGRGGYGVVYKGVLRSGMTIAVKKLFEIHLTEDSKFNNEVGYLMDIKHPNIVQFLGYCAESSWEMVKREAPMREGSGNYIMAEIPKRLICFEYVQNESLDKYISNESSGLEWNIRYEIIRGIYNGLNYLHGQCHIIHLDLKPENILMDANMVPKLADFGLSMIFGDEQSRIITENRQGSQRYMAPEYLIEGTISIKADIFSLGVIIIEIVTGRRDYPLNVSYLQHFNQNDSFRTTEIDTSFEHFKEKIHRFWKNRLQNSQEAIIKLEQIRACVELGLQCTQFSPDKRPVTQDIIARLDKANITDESNKADASTSEIPKAYDIGGYDDEEDYDKEYNDGESSLSSESISTILSSLEMTDQVTELKALESVLLDANAEPGKLSYPFIRNITKNFSQEIGRGGFGVVYLGDIGTGKVAVKKLSIAQGFSDELFVDELKCLIRTKHRNIVKFLGYCADTHSEMVRFNRSLVLSEVPQRLLCFEYVPKGNLQKYLKDTSHKDEWPIRYQMIRGICHGLNYLHGQRIIHLDLKPDNILLDAHMNPKITDFGISRCFDEGVSRIYTLNVRGTRGSIAPETIDSGEITFKSDIYGLGNIIINLLTGRNKYDFENWHTSLDVDGPQVRGCIEIAKACVDFDQRKRPTIGEIMKRLNEIERM